MERGSGIKNIFFLVKVLMTKMKTIVQIRCESSKSFCQSYLREERKVEQIKLSLGVQLTPIVVD